MRPYHLNQGINRCIFTSDEHTPLPVIVVSGILLAVMAATTVIGLFSL